MAESLEEAHDGGRAAAAAGPPWDFNELLPIPTHFSCGFARTHAARTNYAVDANGGGRSPAIVRKISANRSRRTATFTLWRSIASLADPADK